jgi:N-acetylneuraminate synthase
MVADTRRLEAALGKADKFVAGNEMETLILQRRCLRASRDITAGELLTRELIDVLRPNAPESIQPYEIEEVLGLKALTDIAAGDAFRWKELG